MKIFVSVVSFRDPLLKYTVRSLLDEKSGDNKITVGIFEQTCVEDSLLTVDPDLVSHENVKYKRIDPEYADGVVWARYVNASQIEDEEFIYQIDSHMLYDKHWDSYLVQDWELGRKKTDSDKVIISSGCLGFDILDDNTFVKIKETEELTTSAKYFTFQKNLRLPAAHGELIPKTENVEPTIHIFAGNFFAPISWVEEIGYDSRIFFSGEEHHMTLKSFINGWSLFSARQIHAYHYTGTNDYITKHWVDPINKKYDILTPRGNKYWKKFIGTVLEEDLKKYHEYSGVDYIKEIIEERAFTRQIRAIDPQGTPT
tara:strand:- start:243 stop:1181 length:939 start_codon:yes stop_codon:yes gene_type:complete